MELGSTIGTSTRMSLSEPVLRAVLGSPRDTGEVGVSDGAGWKPTDSQSRVQSM